MDDEISQSDQRFYDAYSGLDFDGSDSDVDDVDFDNMEDDLAE
jgi:hypothetical protein